jgi:hypothetical protein
MRLGFIFAWYDLWIGAYWDRKMRRLYILPLPCVGIYVQFAQKTDSDDATMGLTQYHENNAVARPEFMHIRGAKWYECPGCLYATQHGRTPFGRRLWIDVS